MELADLVEELERRHRERAISRYFTDDVRAGYAKHLEFFKAGSTHKLRLFMAGNRVGKSFAAAFEIACHVTGVYPDWWEGKRFAFAQNWWVAGVDSKLVRSELQTILLGPVGSFGTGMIPAECLDFASLRDAKKADTPIGVFRIHHSSGTSSSIEFKSYESGRETFQSAKVNIWLDEEPPLSIFTECLLRTMDTGGEPLMLMLTFTPLKGLSDTILNFLDGNTLSEGSLGNGKYVVRCGWDDVPHLSASDKAILLASIPPWARDARTRGIPQMGSGAIYPIPLGEVSVARFEIPKHWKRFAGMDVGNKTAALWFAISPDNGTLYAYHEYYREGELPAVHAQGICLPGTYVPICIDSAAHARSQIDGENLFRLYKELGLVLHNANKSVETGLYTVWELLASGRLKFFDDLKKLAEEYQIYRKDEKGRVVKERDHLMDCLRYAIMTGRELATNELESKSLTYQPGQVAHQYRPQPLISRRV